MGGKALSKNLQDKIVDWHKSGGGYKKIAKALSMLRAEIYRYLVQHRPSPWMRTSLQTGGRKERQKEVGPRYDIVVRHTNSPQIWPHRKSGYGEMMLILFFGLNTKEFV